MKNNFYLTASTFKQVSSEQSLINKKYHEKNMKNYKDQNRLNFEFMINRKLLKRPLAICVIGNILNH